MSAEKLPTNPTNETPIEVMGDLDRMEAEARDAQQKATETLATVKQHRKRQSAWMGKGTKRQQADFESIQTHLGKTEDRELYEETLVTPELEAADLLEQKHAAIANDDKTALLDIRNHKNGTDLLGEALAQKQLSRRELIELRRTATAYGDQDSVLTIQNALSAKMGLTQSTPEVQQAAFSKLDRLFKPKASEVAAVAEAPVAPTAITPEAVVEVPAPEAKEPVEAKTEPKAETEYPPLALVPTMAENATPDATAEVTETAEENGAESDNVIELKNHRLDVGSAEQALKGEDRLIRDEINHLYAVIDGMGGHPGGDIAASTLQRFLSENISDYSFTESKAVDSMKALFANAQLELALVASNHDSDVNKMGAVLTAVKFFEDEAGNMRAVVGHVGDTRLYLQRAHGEPVEILTEDEGVGPHVANSLQANARFEANQFFVTDVLESGARLMLCTDGITGDTAEEALTYQELDSTFELASEQEVADSFLALSRKEDDKAIIVIDVQSIGETQTENEPAARAEVAEVENDQPDEDEATFLRDYENGLQKVDAEDAPPVVEDEDTVATEAQPAVANLFDEADRLNSETELDGNFMRRAITRARTELRPGGRVFVSEELDEDGNRLPEGGQALYGTRELGFYEARQERDAEARAEREQNPSRMSRLGKLAVRNANRARRAAARRRQSATPTELPEQRTSDEDVRAHA